MSGGPATGHDSAANSRTSRVLLVRHGQASFGKSNYDALSDRGLAQAEHVGAHLAACGVEPARIVSGDLKRQQDTAAGLIQGAAWGMGVETDSGWNEFDADGLFKTYLPDALAADSDLAARQNQLFANRKLFQRAFESVIDRWITAESARDPMRETWPVFRDRILAALARGCAHATESSAAAARPTIIVTSGGPIGVVVGHALGLDARGVFALNWRIGNASVTDLSVRPALQPDEPPSARLNSFNALDGLRLHGDEWVTYR